MKKMKPLPQKPMTWQQVIMNRQPEVVQTPEGLMVPIQKRSRRGRKSTRTSSQPLHGIRLSRGMTLEELAGISQLSPSYLSRLESGSRRLNSDTITRLSKALQCSPGDLLGHSATANSYGADAPKTAAHRDLAESAGTYMDTEAINPNYSPAHSLRTHLPLYGAVYPETNIDFSRPIGAVPCPELLLAAPGAYAIFISDESMAPHYRKGDRILVYPGHPINSSSEVIVITNDSKVLIGRVTAWHKLSEIMPKVAGTVGPDDQSVLELKPHNPTKNQETILLPEYTIASIASIMGVIDR